MFLLSFLKRKEKKSKSVIRGEEEEEDGIMLVF